MNLYVFITYSVADVGGGQMYIKSKAEYLKSKGWDIFVYSTTAGNFLIDDFSQYESGVMKELLLPAYYYTLFKRKHLLKRMLMCCDICSYKQCVIESHSSSLSTWGELLAEQTRAKHLIFDITETPKCPPVLSSFMKFKFDRKELAFIHEKTMKSFFSNENIPQCQCYHLPAYYTLPSIIDIDSSLIDTVRNFAADYVIGIIGRLDKPFVIMTISDIITFLQKNNRKNTFVIIYIGGNANGGEDIMKEIVKQYRMFDNVHLVMTGFLFPMPLRLIDQMDVCISNSGTARAVRDVGVPVITIDSNDFKPIGVLGVTTQNTLYRNDDEVKIEMHNVLNDVLTHKELYLSTCVKEEKCKKDFAIHFSFLEETCQEKVYYSFSKLHYSFSLFCKKILIAIGGSAFYKKLSLICN